MASEAAACESISKWTEDTRIEYVPNGKKSGNYAKYSKAHTVGEAMRLGAKPEDLLDDFMKQLVKVVDADAEGPKAAETKPEPKAAPVETPKVAKQQEVSKPEAPAPKQAKEEDAAKQAKQLKMQQAIDLAKTLGVDLTEAKVLRGSDTIEMMAERLLADRMAQMILEKTEEENRRVTDGELLAVLQAWAFKKNEARQNVLPDGQKWVHSDTLGLVRLRTGAFGVTSATQEYPHVTQVFNRWLKDRCPAEFGGDFPCTSISVNSNYAARRHRDGNNAGPSVIRAFGNFTGGELAYWADDDRSGAVEELNHDDRSVMDLKKGIALFDGCRGHEVNDFEGERFSIVWFSAGKFWTMTEEQREYLTACGFHVKPNEDLGPVRTLLGKPLGYTGCKSLAGMFGKKEAAKVLQWVNPPDAEEDKKADALLSGFRPQLEKLREAKAVDWVEKCRENVAEKDNAGEDDEEVESAQQTAAKAADQEEPEEATPSEMPHVNFGPLDQVLFARRQGASAPVPQTAAPTPTQALFSSSSPAPAVTTPTTPTTPVKTASGPRQDVPMDLEFSESRKRVRPARLAAAGVAEPLSLKRPRTETQKEEQAPKTSEDQEHEAEAPVLPSCGSPYSSMQASAAASLEEALAKLGATGVLMEQQMEGEQVQIHKLGQCIVVYDAQQQEVTASVSEATLAGLRLALRTRACVVEAVLRRGADGAADTVIASDCLWVNGRPLSRHSLKTRREVLARVAQPTACLKVLPYEEFSTSEPLTAEAATALMEEAKTCGVKGVFFKTVEGQYEAGCTSAAWLSLPVA